MFDLYSQLYLPEVHLPKSEYDELRDQRMPRACLKPHYTGLIALRHSTIVQDTAANQLEDCSIADVLLYNIDARRFKGFHEAYGMYLDRNSKPVKTSFILNANDIIVPHPDESAECGFFIGGASTRNLDTFLAITLASQGK